MADKGVAPTELIQLRIKAEIARLHATIAGQELAKAEKAQEIIKLDENIEASKKEIARQQENLDAQLKLVSKNTTGGEVSG